MNKSMGPELEKMIYTKFAEEGWDVVRAEYTPVMSFDMEIFYNGKSYGYVETYINQRKNPRFLLEKIEKIKKMLKTLDKNPLLLIITDGFEYHISENGKPFETIHFVLSPTSAYISNLINTSNEVNTKEDK